MKTPLQECPDCPETQLPLERCHVCGYGYVCPKHGCLSADCSSQRAERSIDSRYERMLNKRMAERLTARDALDVRTMGEEIEPGVFALPYFLEDVDYCDAQREQWIWSIGRQLSTNKIFASYDARFYQNADYECLWLR